MSTPEQSEPVEPEASAASNGAAAEPEPAAAPARATLGEVGEVPEPEIVADAAEITEVSDETVVLRRVPRYGRFIVLGVALGAILALILTFAFPENDQFDRGQVFGFLLLGLGAIGAGFGSVVALLFDRVFASRGGQAIVSHEQTYRAE